MLDQGEILSIHQELSEYLMNDMAKSVGDFDNESHFAYSVMANIAIVGDCIPESMMMLYLSPILEVAAKEIILSSAAYFHGSNILTIQCDCVANNVLCLVSEVLDNDFYFSGIEGKESASPMYRQAMSDVTQLRQSIY